MKKLAVAAVAALFAPAAFAQEEDTTLMSEQLQEITVTAVRAQKDAP